MKPKDPEYEGERTWREAITAYKLPNKAVGLLRDMAHDFREVEGLPENRDETTDERLQMVEDLEMFLHDETERRAMRDNPYYGL